MSERTIPIIPVPVDAKMGITELNGRVTQSNVEIPDLAFPSRPYPGLVSAIVKALVVFLRHYCLWIQLALCVVAL